MEYEDGGIYFPNGWVVVSINDGALYKVFAHWKELYLNGGQWRLNSGITEIWETGSAYIVKGHSGSVYTLNKNEESNLSTWAWGVLGNMLDIANLHVVNMSVVEKEQPNLFM